VLLRKRRIEWRTSMDDGDMEEGGGDSSFHNRVREKLLEATRTAEDATVVLGTEPRHSFSLRGVVQIVPA
jgi:hypothetical protein